MKRKVKFGQTNTLSEQSIRSLSQIDATKLYKYEHLKVSYDFALFKSKAPKTKNLFVFLSSEKGGSAQARAIYDKYQKSIPGHGLFLPIRK